MFNREYQKRATRQGIRSFLAQEFYRPAQRPDLRPRPPTKPGRPDGQLALNFEGSSPLRDLFPEAYPDLTFQSQSKG
jgi:hypothetical protein